MTATHQVTGLRKIVIGVSTVAVLLGVTIVMLWTHAVSSKLGGTKVGTSTTEHSASAAEGHSAASFAGPNCEALIAVDPPLSTQNSSTITVTIAGCDSALGHQPYLEVPSHYTLSNTSPISHTVINGQPPVDKARKWILWDDIVKEDEALTLTTTIETNITSLPTDFLAVGTWKEGDDDWSGSIASMRLFVEDNQPDSKISVTGVEPWNLAMRDPFALAPSLLDHTDVAKPLAIGFEFTGTLRAGTAMTVSLLISNTYGSDIPITGTLTLPDDWSLVSGTFSVSTTVEANTLYDHEIEVSLDEIPCYWTIETEIFIPEAVKAEGYADYSLVLDGGSVDNCAETGGANVVGGGEQEVEPTGEEEADASRVEAIQQQVPCLKKTSIDPGLGEPCSSSVFTTLTPTVACDDTLHVVLVTVSVCSTHTSVPGSIIISGYSDTTGSASAQIASAASHLGGERLVDTFIIAADESIKSVRVESHDLSFSCVKISATCDEEGLCLPDSCPLPGGADPSATPTRVSTSTPTSVLPTRTPTPTPNPTGAALIPHLQIGRLWHMPGQGPTPEPEPSSTPGPTATAGGPSPTPSPTLHPLCRDCSFEEQSLCETPERVGNSRYRLVGAITANNQSVGSLRLRILSFKRVSLPWRPSKMHQIAFSEELSTLILPMESTFDVCIPRVTKKGHVNFVVLELSAADYDGCAEEDDRSDLWSPVSVRGSRPNWKMAYRAYSKPIQLDQHYHTEECGLNTDTVRLGYDETEVSLWPMYDEDAAAVFFQARMIACDNRYLLLDEGIDLKDPDFQTDLTYPWDNFKKGLIAEVRYPNDMRMAANEWKMSGGIVTHEVGHVLHNGLGARRKGWMGGPFSRGVWEYEALLESWADFHREIFTIAYGTMPGVNFDPDNTPSGTFPWYVAEPGSAGGLEADYEDGAKLYNDFWDAPKDDMTCSPPANTPTPSTVPKDQLNFHYAEMMRRPWSHAPTSHFDYTRWLAASVLPVPAPTEWAEFNDVARHHQMVQDCSSTIGLIVSTAGTPIPIQTPTWPQTPLPPPPTERSTLTPSPTPTPTGTITPPVTPTHTPVPTNTPLPTKTPVPTDTPTPIGPPPP